ncbi:MAG: isoprenyl transferase [Candidatus Zixiibacteriota bacterium]
MSKVATGQRCLPTTGSSTDDLLRCVLAGPHPVPRHVAIIMDGNGRWAQRRGLPRSAGHRAGVGAVKRVVMAADEVKIAALTLFAFSTENWGRPKREISAIMRLLYETTKRELRELAEQNVRLITTGDIDALPPSRRAAVTEAIERTRENTGLVLNLALNYSGRTEILHAVRQIAAKVRDGVIDPEAIDEQIFTRFLQTNGLPDPDLLIRTSGERRLSNFLLWQTSYTELYITDTLWPDFGREDFLRAVLDYQSRERRFGLVTKPRG